MKLDEFQQNLLVFVRNTEEAITPQNVSYYLKTSIEESRKHLEELSFKNIILIDSDDDGNIIFKMPNTPRRDNPKIISEHFFPEKIQQENGYKKGKTYFIGKKRSLILFFILSFFTGGIYTLYYLYSLLEEAKLHSPKAGFYEIPSFILLFVPVLNVWTMANNVYQMEKEDNFKFRTFSSQAEIILLLVLSVFVIPAFILLAKINLGTNRHWDYHLLD